MVAQHEDAADLHPVVLPLLPLQRRHPFDVVAAVWRLKHNNVSDRRMGRECGVRAHQQHIPGLQGGLHTARLHIVQGPAQVLKSHQGQAQPQQAGQHSPSQPKASQSPGHIGAKPGQQPYR